MKKSTFRKIYDKLPAQKVVAPKTEWIKRMAEILQGTPDNVYAVGWQVHRSLMHSESLCSLRSLEYQKTNCLTN